MKAPRAGKWSRSNRRLGEGARRQRIVRFLFAFAGLLILGALMFGLLFGEMSVVRYARMAEHHEQLAGEISALEVENQALRRDIERLKNDPVMIESIARERLGMGRPGETVYRFDEARPAR